MNSYRFQNLFRDTIPLARQVANKTIGLNLVPVQPMAPPSGALHYMSFMQDDPYEKARQSYACVEFNIYDSIDEIEDFIEHSGVILINNDLHIGVQHIFFTAYELERDKMRAHKFAWTGEYTLNHTFIGSETENHDTHNEFKPSRYAISPIKSNYVEVTFLAYVPLNDYLREHSERAVQDFDITGNRLPRMNCEQARKILAGKYYNSLYEYKDNDDDFVDVKNTLDLILDDEHNYSINL